MWLEKFNKYRQYLENRSKLNLPQSSNYENWISYQRNLYANNKLENWKIEKLNSIGIKLNKRKRGPNWDWNYYYLLAVEYYKQNGNLLIKQNSGNLGLWIAKQRKAFADGTLAKDKIEKLNQIGMIWFVKETSTNYDRARRLLIETLKVIKNDIENNSNIKHQKKLIIKK